MRILVVAGCVVTVCLIYNVHGNYFRKERNGLQCCSAEKAFKVRSRLECAAICERQPTCKMFRYIGDDKTCYHADRDDSLCGTNDVYFARGSKMVSTGINSKCPTGYTLAIGLCFKYYSEMKSYADAAATCENDGGHLLTIPSHAAMVKFIGDGWTGHVWVDGKGGSKYNGQPLEWAEWYSGFPSACKCISLCVNSQKLEPYPSCDTQRDFACQIDI